jgi:hypothetical protein
MYIIQITMSESSLLNKDQLYVQSIYNDEMDFKSTV